jgi:hypothetical protein
MSDNNGDRARIAMQRDMPRMFWWAVVGIPAVALIGHWLSDSLAHRDHSKSNMPSHSHHVAKVEANQNRDTRR